MHSTAYLYRHSTQSGQYIAHLCGREQSGSDSPTLQQAALQWHLGYMQFEWVRLRL